MARPGSKRQVAIDIMNANADKPMPEVMALIAKAIGLTVGVSRSYYKYMVENSLAAGNIEASAKIRTPKVKVKAEKPAKAPKETKAPKEAKAVTVKAKGNRFTGKVKATAEPKSDADLAKMKEANLKRMQQVTAKLKKQYMPGQYAVPDSIGVPEGWTAEGARAEVAAMYAEMDEPQFLTKDEVKHLV
jgi:hypothetical protein